MARIPLGTLSKASLAMWRFLVRGERRYTNLLGALADWSSGNISWKQKAMECTS